MHFSRSLWAVLNQGLSATIMLHGEASTDHVVLILIVLGEYSYGAFLHDFLINLLLPVERALVIAISFFSVNVLVFKRYSLRWRLPSWVGWIYFVLLLAEYISNSPACQIITLLSIALRCIHLLVKWVLQITRRENIILNLWSRSSLLRALKSCPNELGRC